MRAQGLTNVFAEPGVAEFVRQASHIKLPDGRPLIELHALEGDGEVLALYGAVVDAYRFSAMFNTYTLSEHARHSPGLILLQHMIGGLRAARRAQLRHRGRPRPLQIVLLQGAGAAVRHLPAAHAARTAGGARLPRRLRRQADDQGQARAVGGGPVPAPRPRGVAQFPGE